MLSAFNFIEHRQARVAAVRRQFFWRALLTASAVLALALWWHVGLDRAIRAQQERSTLLMKEQEQASLRQAQADRHADRAHRRNAQQAQIDQQRAQATALPARLGALAIGVVPGLRLQSVEMDHSRTRVSGVAEHEEQVTRYLKALQAQTVGSDSAGPLEVVEVRRSENGGVRFELMASSDDSTGKK